MSAGGVAERIVVENGADTSLLSARLKEISSLPGVYRMLDGEGKILYVGKAINLRRRVLSYFSGKAANLRIMRMVSLVRDIQVTITASEVEALLLEDRLIKKHAPPYNVMLRDDKSYPWIELGTGEFPSIRLRRGPVHQPEVRRFGPFPSVRGVRRTLGHLQREFRLRTCTDHQFANRKRPCLEYQLQRCSAPCVDLVGKSDYDAQVQAVIRLLEGDTQTLLDQLKAEMDGVVAQRQYEKAVVLRDRIAGINRLCTAQGVYSDQGINCDVVALGDSQGDLLSKTDSSRESDNDRGNSGKGATLGMSIVSVRGGAVTDSQVHFLKSSINTSPMEVQVELLMHWYLSRPFEIPSRIYLATKKAKGDRQFLQVAENALQVKAQRSIKLLCRFNADATKWRRLAEQNLLEAWSARRQSSEKFANQWVALADFFAMETLPDRVECVDVSHHQGQHRRASMVVFGRKGPERGKWRIYRLPTSVTSMEEGESGADDYAAMEHFIRKRFAQDSSVGCLPDLLLIDGGPGQLGRVCSTLDEMGVDIPKICAIAKGAGRRPGLERLWFPDQRVVDLPPHSELLRVLLQIRDAAHNHAIQSQRRAARKTVQRSPLEEIPGVGQQTASKLLRAFGGLKSLRKAAVGDLQRLPGIGRKSAEQIFAALHR